MKKVILCILLILVGTILYSNVYLDGIQQQILRASNNTAIASINNEGTLRYRVSGNNSYIDCCMKISSTSYSWINIVQNNW